MKPNYKLLSLIFLSVILFGININSFPLKNWDEAWYGEITKNMALKNTGLLMPYWNGEYYFDKPPLYFWLTTPIVRIFGAGEWQFRIVSIAAAIIATFAVYFIAKKLFNRPSAYWSVLIFLSFGQVVERFSGGNLDALMICMMLLSILCYLNKRLFWTGVFIGFTALSKGFAFILYPMLVIGFLEVFKYKTVRLKIILIPIVAALVSGAWLVAGVIKFGQEFLSVYLGDPLSGNLSWRGEGFSPTLIFTLLRDTGIFVIPGLIILIYFRNKIIKNLSTILALFAASILIFIPLNFFADKIGWYLLPIYPLLAIVAGFTFYQLINIKYWLLICVTVFTAQFLVLINLNNQTPDSSSIGAALGKQVKDYSGKLGQVVLEDNDFSTFLYYSEIGKVRSLQKNTKPSEWWTINHDQFQEIIQNHELITLISKNNYDWEEIGFRKKQSLSFGYSLLQNY